MQSMRWIVPALVMFLLPACGSPPKKYEVECRESTVCPIVVYRTFPMRFDVQPDQMTIKAKGVTKTLVWSFAEREKFVFDVDNATPDGVELVDISNGATVGIRPCFATNDPEGGGVPVGRGDFYRCQVRSHAPEFTVTYKMKFRGREDNVQRSLDPTISNNSDPTFTGARGAARAASAIPILRATLSVSSGAGTVTPSDLPVPRPSDADQTHVVWPAPSGYVFDTNPMQGPYDGIDFGAAPGPTCFAVSAEASVAPVDSGAFFKCIVFRNSSQLPLSYSLTFRELGKAQVMAKGTLSRP